MEDFIRLYDLAESMNINECSFKYHVKERRIPKPQVIFGRLVYDKATADQIREYFANRKKGQHGKRREYRTAR